MQSTTRVRSGCAFVPASKLSRRFAIVCLQEDYAEYEKRARLMTSIHASGQVKRPTPLTTSGANAAGAPTSPRGGGGEAGHGSKDGGDGGSPGKREAPKKAKADKAVAVTAAKKALKRL
jgi:ubiquitin-conjugating enzyme E2 S